MESIRYKVFCLAFADRKLLWKGFIYVNAETARDAKQNAIDEMKRGYPNAFIKTNKVRVAA